MPAEQVRLCFATSAGTVELGISGAVFDCDGLLVDSESVWLEMLQQWLTDHAPGHSMPGTPTSPPDFLGLSVYDTAAQLSRLGRPAQPAQSIVEALSQRYSALLSAGVVPMDGAAALLPELARRVPVAVASNGLRDDVLGMLAFSGLEGSLHSVCTVEQVSAGKPAPHLYLEACDRIGIDPADSVAFEDSPAGCQAAGAAGLTVVGVNADAAIELECQIRLSSLEQVSVAGQEPLRDGQERDSVDESINGDESINDESTNDESTNDEEGINEGARHG